MAEDRESRLARWSRLKQRQGDGAGRGGAAPVAAAPDPDAALTPAPDGGPLAALPGEAPPAGDETQPAGDATLDLPPIDSLNKDSDYTPFLADGVPEKVARAALRKMWSSDPIFGVRDGLDDYDENFRYLRNVTDAMMAKTASEKLPKAPKKGKAAIKSKSKFKKTAAKTTKKAAKATKAAKARKPRKAAAGKSAPGAPGKTSETT